MRLLLASLAAVAAVAFAAPSFAQDTPLAPTPTTKPVKHRTATASSCSALKSQSAKAACLKRAHAHAAKPHKTTKKVAKSSTASQPLPAESMPAAQPAPSQSQTITVPPLPQKTL